MGKRAKGDIRERFGFAVKDRREARDRSLISSWSWREQPMPVTVTCPVSSR
jgi:hypothetical protein